MEGKTPYEFPCRKSHFLFDTDPSVCGPIRILMTAIHCQLGGISMAQAVERMAFEEKLKSLGTGEEPMGKVWTFRVLPGLFLFGEEEIRLFPVRQTGWAAIFTKNPGYGRRKLNIACFMVFRISYENQFLDFIEIPGLKPHDFADVKAASSGKNDGSPELEILQP